MKSLLAIAVSTFLLFFGCGSDTKQEEPRSEDSISTSEISLSAPVQIEDGVHLLYDIKKGTTLKYKMRNYNKSIQSIISDTTMSQSMTQDIEYYFNVKVNDKDESGNLSLDFFCERIKAKGESSLGEKLTYDSKTPPTDSLEKRKYMNFDVLAGVDFAARISSTGEILDIFKTDKILEKIVKEAPKEPTAAEKAQLRNDIQQAVIRPLVQQIFKNTTDKKMNIDSSWTLNYPSQISVFEMENVAQYKLKNFYEKDNSKLAEVDAQLTVKSKGKSEFSEQGVNYNFEKPKTSGSGKLYFDLDRKCIKRAVSDVSFEMTLKMKEVKTGKEAKRIDKIETRNLTELLN
ncbi:MAG: hypothetical protein FJ213_00885 [Ignavibacteria bacterium]|nr:hypothetical protein [Ignavibacteria bacterium]